MPGDPDAPVAARLRSPVGSGKATPMERTLAFALGALVAGAAAWVMMRRAARRAERRAREVEERARRSGRLAYVGQLAGGLAHEIKNPLSTLSLNLQLLEEDLRDGHDPGGRRSGRRLETLQREAERLAAVLDDFLRFARGHDAKLREADLGALLHEVLDFFQPEAAQHGVAVRRHVGELPPVWLDEDLFKQSLFNLLLNARQAMPDGGEIMVQAARENGAVCVHVTDTGVGIRPGEIEAIFRPYYSTKRGGTGLGLPSARRIVEEHGAELRVQSEQGKGTRFSIFLPLAGPSEA